jgi:hypothetical protein
MLLSVLRCLLLWLCVLRLDNDVGTGIHLSPGGVEFDERRLTLGKNTEVSGLQGGSQLLNSYRITAESQTQHPAASA